VIHSKSTQSILKSFKKNLIIAQIISALKKISREKLTRIGLKIFKNLSVYHECISLMIDNKILDFLINEQKKPISDEKIKENISFLIDVVEKNYKVFSSYEKFVKELETEVLVFGPCHTEKFWKEHYKKAENDDFKVIKMIVKLLDSPNDMTKAVACFDLGEFSRWYPFSKVILNTSGGKVKLMKLVENSNDVVRENALVALQKLMIHNHNLLEKS